MIKKCLFLTLISAFIAMSANAQCCSAGNPFFFGEQSNIDYKKLQVITGYKYSLSNQYYHENKKENINFIDKAYFNYLNLQLIYGVTPRLSVQTDLGYFVNRTEQYVLENWPSIRGYGLGDAGITLKYCIYKNHIKNYAFIPSIGVKLPIGIFDQEVDHVKLPITVQPSSGSFKYITSLYFTKTFKEPHINLSLFVSAEFPQLIQSENFYYKYGNMFLFSAVGSWYMTNNISIGIEGRYENRRKSSRENDQVVESSGFSIVYAVPHFSYAFAKQWYIALNAAIPTYKYYNGIQLSNAFSVAIRLSYTLNFEDF